MKKQLFVLLFLVMAIAANATVVFFATPGTDMGSWASFRAHTLYLATEDIAHIPSQVVAFKNGKASNDKSNWNVPIVLPRDTFKSNPDSIWVERKGKTIFSYHIKSSKGIRPIITQKPTVPQNTIALNRSAKTSVAIVPSQKPQEPTSVSPAKAPETSTKRAEAGEPIDYSVEPSLEESTEDTEEAERLALQAYNDSIGRAEDKFHKWNTFHLKDGSLMCKYKKPFDSWEMEVGTVKDDSTFERLLFFHSSAHHLPPASPTRKILQRFIAEGLLVSIEPDKTYTASWAQGDTPTVTEVRVMNKWDYMTDSISSEIFYKWRIMDNNLRIQIYSKTPAGEIEPLYYYDSDTHILQSQEQKKILSQIKKKNPKVRKLLDLKKLKPSPDIPPFDANREQVTG